MTKTMENKTDDITKTRLLEFISSMGVSINTFEREVGLATGHICNINKVTNKMANRVCERYKQLSWVWLLYGRGPMTIQPNEQVESNASVDDVEVIRLQNAIMERDARIRELTKQLDDARDELKRIKSQYDILFNKFFSNQ